MNTGSFSDAEGLGTVCAPHCPVHPWGAGLAPQQSQLVCLRTRGFHRGLGSQGRGLALVTQPGCAQCMGPASVGGQGSRGWVSGGSCKTDLLKREYSRCGCDGTLAFLPQ